MKSSTGFLAGAAIAVSAGGLAVVLASADVERALAQGGDLGGLSGPGGGDPLGNTGTSPHPEYRTPDAAAPSPGGDAGAPTGADAGVPTGADAGTRSTPSERSPGDESDFPEEQIRRPETQSPTPEAPPMRR
jgi:hypothetical protein